MFSSLSQLPGLLLLIFGFGFVIFFHEMGHFLAAKWVGIKVEQFALGFGQAIFSWRKGLGFRLGSSTHEYEQKLAVAKDSAASVDVSGISETEYRLNWLPLGGYVKMLGQDDLNPNAQHDDPRAYNKKSITARMVVVSAGVIMNVILAAIGFMVIFLMGFNTTPPIVGAVVPGSPAASCTTTDGKLAPLHVGDRILMFDGIWQHSFDKIQLNVALSGEGPIPMLVRHRDDIEQRLLIQPAQSDQEASDFLMIGVAPTLEMRGLDPDKLEESDIPNSDAALQFVPADYRAVRPGEIVTAVNGKPMQITDYAKPDAAKYRAMVGDYITFYKTLQDSNGKPLTLTVRTQAGKSEQRMVHPQFVPPFNGTLNFGGMLPRATIEAIRPDSSALDKLHPGDVIASLTFTNGGDSVENPSVEEVRARLKHAGDTRQPVDMVVLRDGKRVDVKGLKANVRVEAGRYGLNVALSIDNNHAVVADTMDKSPAAVAGIPNGAQIIGINGEKVSNWFDVKRLFAAAAPGAAIKIAAITPGGNRDYTLKLDASTIASIAGYRYTHPLALRNHIEPRQTNNPVTAAAWGIGETRDFILQFYLTISRMVQGRLSYKNMMGPVGIFNAGRHFADKGLDWLIWFLAMISANLAVVNFLPIPIVDGGLFAFLIVEKLQGRPLSAKTQSIAQFVGLAIILSVFLLVTYQDIARMF